ncbi:hypothetical protein [Dokdonella sp.]|uniref:hypothetical protein n=1 Tax=Dokdonella sp. TaxID=2291710 RepID=UPI003C5B3235
MRRPVTDLIARAAGARSVIGSMEPELLPRMPGYTMCRSMVGDMTQDIATLESGSTTQQ